MNQPARSLSVAEVPVASRRKERVADSPAAASPPLDAWSGVAAEAPQLVLEPARFEALLDQAGQWAQEITLCLSAPRAASGWLATDRLLRWSVKGPRIFLRHAEAVDGALLRLLHEAGLTAWVESGGKQVASQLLLFARGERVRALFTHLPLDRAANGAAFGTLLCFEGSRESEFSRACQAQVESWAGRCRVPIGSDLDELLARRQAASSDAGPLADRLGSAQAELRIVSDPTALGACLRQLLEPLAPGGGAATSRIGTRPEDAPFEVSIGGDWALSVRSAPGGYRLRLQRRAGRDASAPSFTLSVCTGEAWAAGNALMLSTEGGEPWLVWRGGLLGHSAWKEETLWSALQLPRITVADRGLQRRVAPILIGPVGAGPALRAFADELERLAHLFGADAPPTLGHALADFSGLSTQQQALLSWRALLGLGPLSLQEAVPVVARALRDQGSLRFEGPTAEPQVLDRLGELLAAEAERGLRFDRPEAGQIRAIQPDLDAFLEDDWLHCALGAVPSDRAVTRRTAIRRTFEHAERRLGLFGVQLQAGSLLERAIDSSLSCGVRRGLFARVGVGSLRTLDPHAAAVHGPDSPLFAEPAHAAGFEPALRYELSQLEPLRRMVLGSLEGWGGLAESRSQLARRLGLPLERVEPLEVEGWAALEGRTAFRNCLRQRLERAVGSTDFVPLPLLVREDPWWCGLESHLSVLRSLLPRLVDGAFHLAQLPAGDSSGVSPAPLAGWVVSRTPPLELASACQSLPLSEPLRDELEALCQLAPAESSPSSPSCPLSASDAELEEGARATCEARLRLEDALRSVFRVAQGPLSLPALLEGARQRIEVREEELAAALVEPPFVQLDAERYGLLARDVPGGHAAIARSLQAVADALHARGRALGPAAIAALAERCFAAAGGPELLLCLLGSDPRFQRSDAGGVGLASWPRVGLPEPEEPLRLSLPPAARERFEALVQADSPPLQDALRRADYRLRQLEQAATSEDRLDVYAARRLLEAFGELVARFEPPPRSWKAQDFARAERLARAAIGHFSEGGVCDEDDGLESRAALRAGEIAECGAVLDAVLAHLEFCDGPGRAGDADR